MGNDMSSPTERNASCSSEEVNDYVWSLACASAR